MFTYLLTGLPFLGALALLDFAVLRTNVLLRSQTWHRIAFLCLLTAIFDQLLTGLPIVTYTTQHTLNIRLGYAPIEDFMYSFAAAWGIGIAVKYGERHGRI